MKIKNSISIILILFLSIFMISCTEDNEKANDNEKVNDNKKQLTKSEAISIEDEFINRLFVDHNENTQKVKKYSSKEELIDHISEITEKNIAKSYVNNYYKEKQDGLYIIAKDGPTRIYKDKEYKLEKIKDEKFQLVQETEDALRGKYKFTVKFKYENDKWIIYDRIFERREQNNSDEQVLGDNLIVKSLRTLKLIKEKDMKKLALYVHPEKGLRFSPYSYVDMENDKVFKRNEIANLFESNKKYKWGNYDGKGTPINLTFKEYYNEFIYNEDFINPDIIGNNTVIGEGNTKININKIYPDGKFIEYYISGENGKDEGMDWQSLRLVFEQENDTWFLVGIIHGQWTI